MYMNLTKCRQIIGNKNTYGFFVNNKKVIKSLIIFKKLNLNIGKKILKESKYKP